VRKGRGTSSVTLRLAQGAVTATQKLRQAAARGRRLSLRFAAEIEDAADRMLSLRIAAAGRS
jgi:hypothetical protein